MNLLLIFVPLPLLLLFLAKATAMKGQGQGSSHGQPSNPPNVDPSEQTVGDPSLSPIRLGSGHHGGAQGQTEMSDHNVQTGQSGGPYQGRSAAGPMARVRPGERGGRFAPYQREVPRPPLHPPVKVTHILPPLHIQTDAAGFKAVVQRHTAKDAGARRGQHGTAAAAPTPTNFNTDADYRRMAMQMMVATAQNMQATSGGHGQFDQGAQQQPYPSADDHGKGQLAQFPPHLGALPRLDGIAAAEASMPADHRGKAIQQEQQFGAGSPHWQNVLTTLFGPGGGHSSGQHQQPDPIVHGLDPDVIAYSQKLHEKYNMVQDELEKRKDYPPHHEQVIALNHQSSVINYCVTHMPNSILTPQMRTALCGPGQCDMCDQNQILCQIYTSFDDKGQPKKGSCFWYNEKCRNVFG